MFKTDDPTNPAHVLIGVCSVLTIGDMNGVDIIEGHETVTIRCNDDDTAVTLVFDDGTTYTLTVTKQ